MSSRSRHSGSTKKRRVRTVLDNIPKKGTSDDDTGYLWGKKGRAKAEKHLKDSKTRKGYLWKGEKHK